VIGAVGGVFVGLVLCAVLHWLFLDVDALSAMDAVIVSICGIVGMGLDMIGNRTRDE
jgi:hypothetical protein